MTIFKWYLQPMGGMVKGKIPFDAAIFADKAKGLATAASLDLTEGFPEGSREDSDAKPEIWQDWNKFVAAAKTMGDESGKLARLAQSGDMAAIGAQVKAVGKSCGGCHKPFRKPKAERFKR